MRVSLNTFCFIFLFLLFVIVPSNSQENKNESRYVISKYEYVINGSILETALAYTLELKEDVILESREKLLEFLMQKRIELINLRQVENTSSISYESVWKPEKEQFEVTIYVFVESAFSLIALPYFSYNSSEGLVLSVRGRDYNFLGTLERAFLDLNYELENDGSQSFGAGLGFSYPFSFGKHTFISSLSESFNYTLSEKFTNRTALAFQYIYSINTRNDVLFLTEQALNTNTENSAFDTVTNYFSTRLELAYQTILADLLPLVKTIRYKPLASVTFTYPIGDFLLPDKTSKYAITLSHLLTVGRIDWINNFRQGIEFSLANPYTYYQYYEGWVFSFVFQSRGFVIPTSFMGLGYKLFARVESTLYSNNMSQAPTNSFAAEKLRGIKNDAFKDNNALVLNTDMDFRLFAIPRVAEFHGSLFYDFGIRTLKDERFSLSEDTKHTIGIEGFAFALFSRNFVVRLSYGLDIVRVFEERQFDIFEFGEIDFGLNLHY